ncbi:MAG: prepilin-type N-terminal cleavage/methylation domain-containing protein [Deltaproteobacteria bacterium]|nr:prepilin-type N-terminal cleavage/methylation domain-containing protein [Deltaproteobacteria bacterium]
MNDPGRISSPGFTLLELIIVMIIIGLMSVLVVPVIGGSLSNMELKTAAKKTASALRYCRNKAATQKTTYIAGIDFATNIISVENKKKASEKPGETDEPDLKTYKLPDGVHMEKIVSGDQEIDSGRFKITFFPNGSCSGGLITLAGTREKQYNINLDSITGIVTIVN